MLAYLTYMAERLEHMHRLLKPTGTIYLHCDPTASHYLKVVMDAIFKVKNFRNEIIWYYKNASRGKRKFANSHDVLLWYAKDHENTFFNLDKVLVPYESGMTEWRYTRGGQSGKKKPKGKVPDDVIVMPSLNAMAGERIGYPTQKPIDLMKKIIIAGTKNDDIVLDPFCGCGTTIDAARQLHRHWVGIDISSFAIDLIRERRLQDASIPTRGIPTDLVSARKLAGERPFDFESWAVTRLPGFAPNMKKVADGGVDGRAILAEKPDDYDSTLALAQIKGGKFNLSALRDFIGVTKRDRAALGCYVTLDPVNTTAAKAEIADTGKITVSGHKYPRMQIYPISDYFKQRSPKMPIMNDPYTGKPMNQLGLI